MLCFCGTFLRVAIRVYELTIIILFLVLFDLLIFFWSLLRSFCVSLKSLVYQCFWTFVSIVVKMLEKYIKIHLIKFISFLFNVLSGVMFATYVSFLEDLLSGIMF